MANKYHRGWLAEAISSSNMRRSMNILPLLSFPEDILEEHILLKVPGRSLLSLRCVCKHLRKIITGRYFIKKHLNHSLASRDKQLVLLSSARPDGPLYSVNFNRDQSNPDIITPPPFMSSRIISGCCHGLLLLSDKDCQSSFIWNMLTKEYKQLPIPSIQNPLGNDELPLCRTTHLGLGYDSNIDDYKVIRCDNFSRGADSITVFHVYTLGTDSWRSICTENNPYKSFRLAHKRQGLFVNGSLHWIMSDRRDTTLKESVKPVEPKRIIYCKAVIQLGDGARIISLDIETEKLEELWTPPGTNLMNGDGSWELHVLGGQLFIHQEVGEYIYTGEYHRKANINVWIYRGEPESEGNPNTWRKFFTIMEPLASPDSYSRAYFKLLAYMENGEILISTNEKLLMVYNKEADSATVVHRLGGTPGSLMYRGTYVESLLSLNSGTYTG